MHHSRSWQIQNIYPWNGLNIRWYIRPIRFENSIRNRIGRPIRFEIRFERKKTIRRSLRFTLNLKVNGTLHCKRTASISLRAFQCSFCTLRSATVWMVLLSRLVQTRRLSRCWSQTNWGKALANYNNSKSPSAAANDWHAAHYTTIKQCGLHFILQHIYWTCRFTIFTMLKRPEMTKYRTCSRQNTRELYRTCKPRSDKPSSSPILPATFMLVSPCWHTHIHNQTLTSDNVPAIFIHMTY